MVLDWSAGSLGVAAEDAAGWPSGMFAPAATKSALAGENGLDLSLFRWFSRGAWSLEPGPSAEGDELSAPAAVDDSGGMECGKSWAMESKTAAAAALEVLLDDFGVVLSSSGEVILLRLGAKCVGVELGWCRGTWFGGCRW